MIANDRLTGLPDLARRLQFMSEQVAALQERLTEPARLPPDTTIDDAALALRAALPDKYFSIDVSFSIWPNRAPEVDYRIWDGDESYRAKSLAAAVAMCLCKHAPPARDPYAEAAGLIEAARRDDQAAPVGEPAPTIGAD